MNVWFATSITSPPPQGEGQGGGGVHVRGSNNPTPLLSSPLKGEGRFDLPLFKVEVRHA